MGLSESAVRRIAVAATAAALVASGVALYYYFKAAAAGDEPPIRVKGGSLHLDLLHASGGWIQPTGSTDKKKWHVGGGNRRTEEFLVYLAPKDGASCPPLNPNPANENQYSKKKVKKVDILFHLDSDTNHKYWVKMHATGKKTKVYIDAEAGATASLYFDESNQQLALKEDGSEAAGFIKEVHLGNRQVCTFASKDDLESLLLTEEPEEKGP